MSLRDSVPDIEQNLADAVAQARAESEAFSLDKLRYPATLRRVEGQKMMFEAPRHLQYCTDTSCQIYGADEATYTPQPAEGEPCPVEQAMEEFANKLSEAVVSYGYDPEVVNQWFETAGQNWEDLGREQDKANAALAQQ